MRLLYFYISCLLIFAVLPTSAQYTKQVIQLKNKAFTTGTITNPSTYLNPRAIQRRTRYGIAIDSTDLPISQRWLDSIRSVPNVQVLSLSRWLNRVLIQTSDAAAISRINNFPFVQSTTPQGLRIGVSKQTHKEKFHEKITGTDPSLNRIQQLQGMDSLNYGFSYAQVHIHEGEFLHNRNFKGQGMVIAVLDGGFNDYKYNGLLDSIRLQGRILGERDFVDFDNSVNEDIPHGMQCLSTLCANWPGQMVGTATDASYWLIRTEKDPTEYPLEEFNWVVGAEFADSVGADLISSSLGYTTFDDSQFDHTYADLNGNTATSTIGADLAAKKGLLVTNAAGNEGSTGWNYIIVPADGDSVVAVGAVDANGYIAGFSSRGVPADPRIKPNVVSVGAGTVIAGPGGPIYGFGTSYANPNLNGLIACLWQAFPEKNNQQIMNVVYQSSDRYANPDKTYGYGIPNFRKAYRILKKERNDATFGTAWLKASPNPFSDTIRVTFVGQRDGTATLTLINPTGTVVATKTILIEEQEIYTTRFDATGSLPAGIYTVKYTDSINTRIVQLNKSSTDPDFSRDWLLVYPVPYSNNFTVTVKSPVAGTAIIRLVDVNGHIVTAYTRQVALNEIYTYQFAPARMFGRGIYFLQYDDGTNKRVRKVGRQ